jgi:2-isopropylmalate synthase
MQRGKMSNIYIYDTTMRDGEQAPGMSMNPDAKHHMARQLVRLGVDAMEAGFPASSEADVVALRRIGRDFGNDAVISGLCRARVHDVEMAADALESAKRKRFHIFVPTSDIHIVAKFDSSRQAVVDAAGTALDRARALCDDVQFGLEDATRADPAFLAELIELGLDFGVTTVTVADTVGYSTPAEFGQLLTRLHQLVPDLAKVVVAVHCHDDLGMAVANSLAGVEAGARQIECAVNGIGERAGNASLEEVVMALTVRSSLFGCRLGLDTKQLCATSQALVDIVGVEVPPNKAVVGANAFAHEAGIHQHGVLANPLTYEIMTPESVGALGSRLVFGRHSGHHALAALLAQHDIVLDTEQLLGTLRAIKSTGHAQVPVPTVIEIARQHVRDPAIASASRD